MVVGPAIREQPHQLRPVRQERPPPVPLLRRRPVLPVEQPVCGDQIHLLCGFPVRIRLRFRIRTRITIRAQESELLFPVAVAPPPSDQISHSPSSRGCGSGSGSGARRGALLAGGAVRRLRGRARGPRAVGPGGGIDLDGLRRGSGRGGSGSERNRIRIRIRLARQQIAVEDGIDGQDAAVGEDVVGGVAGVGGRRSYGELELAVGVVVAGGGEIGSRGGRRLQALGVAEAR